MTSGARSGSSAPDPAGFPLWDPESAAVARSREEDLRPLVGARSRERRIGDAHRSCRDDLRRGCAIFGRRFNRAGCRGAGNVDRECCLVEEPGARVRVDDACSQIRDRIAVFAVVPIVMALLSHQQKMTELFTKQNSDSAGLASRVAELEKRIGSSQPGPSLADEDDLLRRLS